MGLSMTPTLQVKWVTDYINPFTVNIMKHPTVYDVSNKYITKDKKN